MMAAAIAILAFVTLQRLAELWLSNRNTRALMAQGGVEHSAGHYPLIVAVHTAWLLALWWLAPDQPVSLAWLALFCLLQLGRIWVLATLGPRWTTRIIILPGAPLVRSGPFRFVRHPNYLIVAGEIAVLPIVFGLWPLALLFSLLNAAVLAVRIKAEDTALRH
jgi:methyltransferase